MKKSIIIIGISIFLIITSKFAYQKYKYDEFIDLASWHLKNTSLVVEGELKHELDTKSKIAPKEIIIKIEEDLAEMDRRKLEIQTATNENNSAQSLIAVEYIKASQSLVRSILEFHKKSLASSKAYELHSRRINAFKDSIGSNGYEYQKNALEDAGGDYSKASSEFFETIPEVLASAKNLKALSAKAAKIFPRDVLIPQVPLDDLINSFAPYVKDKGQPGKYDQ